MACTAQEAFLLDVNNKVLGQNHFTHIQLLVMPMRMLWDGGSGGCRSLSENSKTSCQ